MAKKSAHGRHELAQVEYVRPDYEGIKDCLVTIDRMTKDPANYIYHGPHFVKQRSIYALMSDGWILHKVNFVHCEVSNRSGESKQHSGTWSRKERFKAEAIAKGPDHLIAAFKRRYSYFTISKACAGKLEPKESI